MRLTDVSFPRTLLGILSIVCLIFSGCDSGDGGLKIGAGAKSACPLGEAVESQGLRRLALIVGVGQYKNDKIPDLAGPPNDAKRIYDLLTGRNGYGFPKENVCLLFDEQATTAKFKEAFEKALVERARPDDVAFIFYAGHGSQTGDKNHDEPDMKDETFLLHDARTDGIGDLVDDEFNMMLARLHKKTSNVTVAIDSCNSGTATRGEAGTFTARFFEPMEESASTATASAGEGKGDGGADWFPDSLPGVVIFTAASDGTPALETEGRGIFTDALIQVLSKVDDQPLTYAQAARQIPALMAATSYQIPYFQGELNRPIFGNKSRTQPIAWEVTALGPPLELAGPSMAGMGTGAELRVYDGAATGADTRDPGKAKATVIIEKQTRLNATARISAAQSKAPKIAVGDLAVIVRPADKFLKIKVRLRQPGEIGGIPGDRSAALRGAMEKDPEAKLLVELTERAGDFEMRTTTNGRLQLLGPENRIRNTYSEDSKIPASLWQHARQRALLALQGEGGGQYKDNKTLQVQLVPAAKQSPCADGTWEQAAPNTEQVVPLCHAWNIRISLSKDSPTPLLVGGVILSTDGGTYGLPADGRKELLKPGESVILRGNRETFSGLPPLDAQDRILVFGTQEKNPVPWHLLTSSAATRAAGPPKSGLYRALDSYLTPGTRGVKVESDTENTPWTMSTVTMRVEANQRFLKPQKRDAPISQREYTIKNFDIRPYLPDNTEASLHKVLQQTDWLAKASVVDGIGYKQHDWNKSTDEQNLRLGIDCSRFVWYVFTRAGLPYNRDDRYLATAHMFGANTLMKDQFDSCDKDQNLRLGDVLVYRDAVKGDGHTVMVVDPRKQVAVGSHGYDGNPSILPVQPDTGVEYQQIKFKQHMLRWDRPTMELKACWRYRGFSEDAKKPGGMPGTDALATVCDVQRRCGR